jgi:hypothetical protein
MVWRDEFGGVTRREYDVQQVCLNGHIITNYFRTEPQDAKKFCTECGAETITACQSCQQPLRGEELNPSVIVGGFNCQPPAFCYHCGSRHPWTQRKIDTALQLAAEVEDDEQELDKLRASIPDLTSDTPATSLAVVRMKKFLFKAKDTVGPALKELITQICTEAVKQQLGMK